MKSFGLGEKTGVDLPNETRGLIGNLESPRKVEYATASFGQGMALTPIATARALSVLGNGGTLVTPHVVKKVEYEMGSVKESELASEKRVISQESSEEITRMLVKVVDDALLGGTVALDNHSIAAKTGTAQIADPSTGGYFEDKFLHSFFGYFPAYDPEFLILLMNIEPKEARYASETLTRPFMDLAQFLIQYYEIPPDR
jgi:cell division protein FtsI/penicillin-binding protein 2